MPPTRKAALPDGAAWTPKPAPKRVSVPTCPNFLRVGPEDVPVFRTCGDSMDVEGRLPPEELLDGFMEEPDGSELPELRQVVGFMGRDTVLPTDARLSPRIPAGMGKAAKENR